MNRLKNILRTWLGFDEQERRLFDLERHFVTKRDEKGQPIQTLADVPVKDRKELKTPTSMRGMTMQQRLAWLEKTDGGRRLPNGETQQVSITAR